MPMPDALTQLDGRSFQPHELRVALAQVVLRSNLPPGIGVDDLIRSGYENGWLRRDKDGKLVVVTNGVAAYSTGRQRVKR